MAPSAVPREPGEISCDVLVVGAGLGGAAAALRAARLGRHVCLVEETGWPGGQMSTQGVSALDEHRYIESFGGTGAYYEFRNGIRNYYRKRYALAPPAVHDPLLNPGNAWVSRLSFEPRAGAAVIAAMLAGPHGSGGLQVFYHTRAVSASLDGGRIASVLARREDGVLLRFRPAYVLDATDLGDMFVLTGTAYALGAEARAETAEPSAPERADSGCVQDFTFPFAVEFCPGEDHTIDRPEGYEENRDRQPYTLVYKPRDRKAPAYRMFETAPGTHGPFWTYRRALDARNFADPAVPRDISIINWTANDFRGGTVVDRSADDQARLYRQARLLSLGFLYWLQTEAPRDDGGKGYPELRLCPEVMGSPDGLSQVPYVREGRRLRALSTILEQDISAASQPASRAARCPESVGIGFYPIDLHRAGTEATMIPTRPFQIPLGAVIPTRTINLLAAAKNIGTTHLTNGAYRLHPVEWAVGEAASTVAVFCLSHDLPPREVLARPDLVRQLQILLLDQAIPLYWYDDVPVNHAAFAATQLLAIDGAWEGNADDLHFSPDAPVGVADGKRLMAEAARRIRMWRGGAAADPEAILRPAAEDKTLPLRRDAAVTLFVEAFHTAPRALPDGPLTRADLAIWLGAVLRSTIEGV